jgi:hypothetical protein
LSLIYWHSYTTRNFFSVSTKEDQLQNNI